MSKSRTSARLLCLLVFSSAAMAAHGAFDSSGWTWQAPLLSPDAASGFVEFRVSPQILDLSQAGLDDLRVCDENARLVPHRIFWEDGSAPSETIWRDIRLLNAVYQPGEYARVTLDFGASLEKNLLKITLSGANFRRKAMIEGAPDTERWERVAENLYLFSIDQPGHNYRLDTLSFSVNDFRYLRLTVYQMPDEGTPFRIDRVEAAFKRPAKSSEIPIAVADAGLSWNAKEQESTLELDLRYRNIPVSSIHLDIADSYFYRPYVFEGRNATTESLHLRTETGGDRMEREAPWRRLGGGVLYRIPGETGIAESTAIAGIRAPYRYLRIRFFEGDNPTLRIDPGLTRVFWRPPRLLFDWNPDRAYTLWGGNPEARAPRYDLAQAAPNLDPDALPKAVMGEMERILPRPPVIPWTERHGWVLTALLVLAVAATAVVIGRAMKSMKRENPGA